MNKYSEKEIYPGSGVQLPEDEKTNPEKDKEVLERFAKWIVKKQLTVPAIMFFEMSKPLSYIGSQAMIFAEPIVDSIVHFKEYAQVRRLMEKRENVELFIQIIEKLDAEARIEEKKAKAEAKEARKKKGSKGIFSIFKRKKEK